MTKLSLRKTNSDIQLSEKEFKKKYLRNFYDPRFKDLESTINEISHLAWLNYKDGRKAPITRKAGPGYKDPTYDLSQEWIETKEAIHREQNDYDNLSLKPHVLLINGSHRSEHTCPSEISKTSRLIESAERIFLLENIEVKVLDLSLLTSEFGKNIHPCKACVSTAMPLCHWPCSCYPNHSLGQAQDWMNEIYPMWARAHGVMIITPTYWYGLPSGLKLMLDRMVCADGGNPDPTSTNGKDAMKAKELEADWDFPGHLEGRFFSLLVHGDANGVDLVRNSLRDSLEDMRLINAGGLSRYIGYMKPYATSHEELDKEKDLFKEVEELATTLSHSIKEIRSGLLMNPSEGYDEVRRK